MSMDKVSADCLYPGCFFCVMKEGNPSKHRASVLKFFRELPSQDDDGQVVEITKESKVKYELDKKTGLIKLIEAYKKWVLDRRRKFSVCKERLSIKASASNTHALSIGKSLISCSGSVSIRLCKETKS